MNKSTIFGEEKFIPENMVKINIHDNMIRSIDEYDNYIIDQIESISKVFLPEIEINHDKVRRWAMLCYRLEHIDQSDLIDIATKKKFEDLQDELDQQKAMWNELKEYLINTLEEKKKSHKYYKFNDVLDKMQELEGEKDVKD